MPTDTDAGRRTHSQIHTAHAHTKITQEITEIIHKYLLLLFLKI